jgi:hypothetical protein
MIDRLFQKFFFCLLSTACQAMGNCSVSFDWFSGLSSWYQCFDLLIDAFDWTPVNFLFQQWCFFYYQHSCELNVFFLFFVLGGFTLSGYWGYSLGLSVILVRTILLVGNQLSLHTNSSDIDRIDALFTLD